MAFSISVYQSSINKTYQVNIDCVATVLDKVHGSPVGTGELDYYLKISTTMKKSNGTSFPSYIVRNLYDLPSTSGSYAYNVPATNFTDLIDSYVDYFIYMAELTLSSSSSSISSSSSVSSSSSSSSYGYSESSLSSASISSMSTWSSSSSTWVKSSSSSSSTEWMSSSSSSSSSTEWKSSSSSSSTEWMSSSSSSSTP